jgi:CheY-like chemotaxis protein
MSDALRTEPHKDVMASVVPKRVLLVEDNRDALSGLYMLLSNAGFSVLMAENGDEALFLIDRGVRPDVIVLDLMMPKVSGWDILKQLQQDPELREIPVIVVTALDREDAHVVGADVVMQKPIQPGELISEVQRLTTGREE